MEDLLYVNGAGTFTVSYRKTLGHHMPMSHFHSSYEIFYLMSGKREFFIKDRTMVIQEGDVMIVAPNILHRTTNTETPEHERLIANLHTSYMMQVNGTYSDVLQPLFDQEYLIVRCPLHERMLMDDIALQIKGELESKKPGFEMYMQVLVLQLLIICCRHTHQNENLEALKSPSPMHERISEIVRYINSHYAQALSLQFVAEKFYISPYYLSRFFKEATGFTFVEYLNSVRVKEAKKLLEQSKMKIHLIAKKVGFGSVTHFGRVFRSVTGHNPMYYRKDNMLRK